MKRLWHRVAVGGVIVVVLVLLLAALPACKAGPEAPNEIVLGATEGLAGMAAGFAAGSTFGLRAAVEDINKLGGIYIKEYDRKLPVRLVLLDNESDPAKAGTETR